MQHTLITSQRQKVIRNSVPTWTSTRWVQWPRSYSYHSIDSCWILQNLRNSGFCLLKSLSCRFMKSATEANPHKRLIYLVRKEKTIFFFNKVTYLFEGVSNSVRESEQCRVPRKSSSSFCTRRKSQLDFLWWWTKRCWKSEWIIKYYLSRNSYKYPMAYNKIFPYSQTTARLIPNAGYIIQIL